MERSASNAKKFTAPSAIIYKNRTSATTNYKEQYFIIIANTSTMTYRDIDVPDS